MDDNFGVPAGWYPDPLGLPQLRWWDAQSWTEHTSEVRAPMIVQPAARWSFVDDEVSDRDTQSWDDLPSRREQREREREDSSDLPRYATASTTFAEPEPETETEPDEDRDELSAQPLLAMTLKELEPPLTDTLDEQTPGPRRASSHTNAAPAASMLSALAEEDEAPTRAPKRMHTYTGAVWFIALMPLLQLATSVLLIVGGLGQNLPLYLARLVRAVLHRSRARRVRPPRAHALGSRATGPRVVGAACAARLPSGARDAHLPPDRQGVLADRRIRDSVTAVLAGILVLPGLIIAAVPGYFANEVASSVEADAAVLGAHFTVVCPAPPLIVGQTFACIGTKDDGTWDSISVRLSRQSGWIDWRVEDWGPDIMIGS